MAAPTLVNHGGGSTDAGGAWTATCFAPAASGNIIIFYAVQCGGTNWAVTSADQGQEVGSTTNITSLAGTSGSWTRLDFEYGAGNCKTLVYIGRSTGTSAPVITGSNSTSEDLYWAFLEYSGVSTGTTLANVIENTSPTETGVLNGSNLTVQSVQWAGSIIHAPLTTTGDDRLGVMLGFVTDAVTLGTPSSPWQSWSFYSSSSGTDGSVAMWKADMPSATSTTIETKAFSPSTPGYGKSISFALLPVYTAPPAAGYPYTGGGYYP